VEKGLPGFDPGSPLFDFRCFQVREFRIVGVVRMNQRDGFHAFEIKNRSQAIRCQKVFYGFWKNGGSLKEKN